MMSLIKDIKIIFTKKEIKYLWIIFFGVFVTTILDIISFATIIPVFNIIFLNKLSLIPFFNLDHINLDAKFKILILIFFVLIFIIKNIFVIWFNFFFINFFKSTNIRISNDLFSLFLNQEYIFYLKNSSENFLQKATNDVSALNYFLISLINLIIEIIFLVGISILLINTNFKIFLFCSLNFIIVLIIYIKIFKSRIKFWSSDYRESLIKVQDLILEGLKGFKDIILYNLKTHFINNFYENLSNNNNSKSRIDFLNNVQRYWLEIVAIFAMASALTYFVTASSDINKLIPVFALFTLVMFRLLSSLSRIILHGQYLKFYFPSVIAVVKEFKQFSDNKKPIQKQNFIFNSNIEIKNASFSYFNDKNKILDNVNLKIKKGDCIGVVGKNGSGKSTLLNLISGLIKPSEGKIIVDDTYDLYSNRENWNNNLSYVQQNIFLLNSTIEENIVLTSKDRIDSLKFNKVLNILKLNQHFKDLPEKLNTKVGNDGISLSGGQKQMISLARALYRDNNILILDEPTSALDSIKIEQFKNIILSLKGIKTIIMVTHNKDFFLDCFDFIVELKSGKLNDLKNK